MQPKTCPECKFANKYTSSHCTHCGFILPPVLGINAGQEEIRYPKCPFCEQKIKQSSETCPTCNKSLLIPWYDNLLIKLFSLL